MQSQLNSPLGFEANMKYYKVSRYRQVLLTLIYSSPRLKLYFIFCYYQSFLKFCGCCGHFSWTIQLLKKNEAKSFKRNSFLRE